MVRGYDLHSLFETIAEQYRVRILSIISNIIMYDLTTDMAK